MWSYVSGFALSLWRELMDERLVRRIYGHLGTRSTVTGTANADCLLPSSIRTECPPKLFSRRRLVTDSRERGSSWQVRGCTDFAPEGKVVSVCSCTNHCQCCTSFEERKTTTDHNSPHTVFTGIRGQPPSAPSHSEVPVKGCKQSSQPLVRNQSS